MEKYIKSMADNARSKLEKSKKLIEHFTQVAASNGVMLDLDAFSYIQTIGIVATAPGLANKLLNITPSERDGLFAYSEIAQRLPPNRFLEGYFVGKDYMLMAHPCYRRCMHPMANWAPRFVDLFWRFDSPNIKKFIAIDEDRVRINVDRSAYREKDTWYGAPFNEDIGKIKNGTIKLRPSLDLESHCIINDIFAQTYCLDIKWSEANQIKTFQALEIKTRDIQIIADDQTYFPARYLHAEFDLSTGYFRHFDGAIQFFTEEEYLRRRNSDFNITFKNHEHIKARSKKVFKLNGSLNVDSWVEFCCHFFTANPLTFEYFTGAYPEYVTDTVAKVRARLL
ncbi:hypothetical protein [Nitrosomonas oligotropha]|nr:hypothetical protein [Nitrosomonas oligotropha]